jgi:hypothetical protein
LVDSGSGVCSGQVLKLASCEVTTSCDGHPLQCTLSLYREENRVAISTSPVRDRRAAHESNRINPTMEKESPSPSPYDFQFRDATRQDHALFMFTFVGLLLAGPRALCRAFGSKQARANGDVLVATSKESPWIICQVVAETIEN